MPANTIARGYRSPSRPPDTVSKPHSVPTRATTAEATYGESGRGSRRASTGGERARHQATGSRFLHQVPDASHSVANCSLYLTSLYAGHLVTVLRVIFLFSVHFPGRLKMLPQKLSLGKKQGIKFQFSSWDYGFSFTSTQNEWRFNTNGFLP